MTTPPATPGLDQTWFDTSLMPSGNLASPTDPTLVSGPSGSPAQPEAPVGPGGAPPWQPLQSDPTPSILLPRQSAASAPQQGAEGTDKVSLTAFVLSLIGGVGIAHVLGFLGLKRTEGGQKRGRKLAVASLVIATVWLLGLVTVGVVALVTIRGKIPATDLSTGACVDGEPQGEVARVKVVDCSSPHTAEVMGTFTLSDASFPGNEALVDQAEQRCPDYVPDGVDPQLAIYYLVPTSETWSNGDHDIVCMIVSTGDPLTEPLT